MLQVANEEGAENSVSNNVVHPFVKECAQRKISIKVGWHGEHLASCGAVTADGGAMSLVPKNMFSRFSHV